MTNPGSSFPVADLSTYRARAMTRCAQRGHDWADTATGQSCTRCTMTITMRLARVEPERRTT